MTLVTATPVLDPSLYIAELKPRTREPVLVQMVVAAQRAGVVRGSAALLELLRLRERVGSTAIGKGAAIPHARSLTVDRPALVVARSHRGIGWDAPDGQPVHVVLLVLSPGEWSEETHHAFLGRVAAVARLQKNRQRLLEAGDFLEVSSVLREAHP